MSESHADFAPLYDAGNNIVCFVDLRPERHSVRLRELERRQQRLEDRLALLARPFDEGGGNAGTEDAVQRDPRVFEDGEAQGVAVPCVGGKIIDDGPNGEAERQIVAMRGPVKALRFRVIVAIVCHLKSFLGTSPSAAERAA